MEIGQKSCFDDVYVKLEYGSPGVKIKVTQPKYGKTEKLCLHARG
jgi:hypothetical protein